MTKKKRFIATLDIETRDGLKGSKFAVGGFYLQYSNKDIIIIERDIDTFIEKILNFIRITKIRKVLCYIHNLDFDIRFIINYFITKKGVNPRIVKSAIGILETEFKTDDYHIVFRDSYQFLLMSQEKAEKEILGKKIKKDVEFEPIIKDFESGDKRRIEKAYRILEERVTTDIKGLYQTIEEFDNINLEEYNNSMHSYCSNATFRMSCMQKEIKKKYNLSFKDINPYIRITGSFTYAWINEKMKELYHWTRKAYFGGICNVYNLNKVYDVYYYDANSLYPSMYSLHEYPTPNCFVMFEDLDISYFMKNVYEKDLYITEMTIEEYTDKNHCFWPADLTQSS